MVTIHLSLFTSLSLSFSSVYNQFRQSDKERKLFSLAGTSHSDHRMDIYKFLLSHMKDEHRFQLTAKICQEVKLRTQSNTVYHIVN